MEKWISLRRKKSSATHLINNTWISHQQIFPLFRTILIDYMVKLSPKHQQSLTAMFDSHIPQALAHIVELVDVYELRDFFEELNVYFKVPNKQMESNNTPPLSPNRVIAAFVDFLLLMIEAILHSEEDFIASVSSSFKILRTELGFLITFLGDIAMNLQHTTNILIDIEGVVNEVGSFIYSLFLCFYFSKCIACLGEDTDYNVTNVEQLVNKVRSFLHSEIFLDNNEMYETKNVMMNIKTMVNELESSIIFFENDQVHEAGILDFALSNLLPKFDLLKTKIKEHCVVVSKMLSDNMAQKSAVVSPFIINSVLDDLIYLMNKKSHMIVGVYDQIVTLHEELMLLESLIMDVAEHEELSIQAVDIAYEVEYVINSFPPVWYLTLRLPQLIEKIQHSRKAIQEHETKNNVAGGGVPRVAKYPSEQLPSPSKQLPDVEDIVLGIENVEVEIADQLVGGTHQLQLVSICGMPGLGKTTLAKKLYNHPSVVYHFYKCAWCVVSQTYDKKNIFVDILCSIKNVKRETAMEKGEESLAEEVYRSLRGMRYLIVMDDIWDTQVWIDLSRYFPDDGIGSRILFTTRNKEVGLEASPCSIINELPFLSEDDCWELLQLKVFKDRYCPQELRDIGKQIARNCRGLPLAVAVIAGILANMEMKEHLWRNIARSLSSHISENQRNCIDILELSYQHLPMHLRPCFLYFAAFKEDMEIPVRKLISLWIAKGYIKKEEHKSLEDVGLEYVMKLIDRSMVLVAARRSNGVIKTCSIHDLMREMCSRIAEEKMFLKMVKFDKNDPQQFSSQVAMCQQHHCLSISPSKSDYVLLPFAPRVRSLLCSGVSTPVLLSSSYKVLKVLDFYERMGDVVIGIEHLAHLRYLTISCDELPPMESFHRLEFLFVENKFEVEIPEILLNMVSMRHMHLSGGARFSASCRLQATNYKSFQENHNLESISVIKILDETDEKILRRFPNLKTLKGKVRCSMNPSFDFLNQLESLKLESDWTYHSSFLMITLPLNLKKLSLIRVHLSQEQMEAIGRLQQLEVLKLELVEFEGTIWETSEGEFPQLKFLRLCAVGVKEWKSSSEHFPRLERLVLQYCLGSRMIPSSFGDIQTLQKIEVTGCAQAIKESAQQIQEEQEENGNEHLKVVISDWRPFV